MLLTTLNSSTRDFGSWVLPCSPCPCSIKLNTTWPRSRCFSKTASNNLKCILANFSRTHIYRLVIYFIDWIFWTDVIILICTKYFSYMYQLKAFVIWGAKSLWFNIWKPITMVYFHRFGIFWQTQFILQVTNQWGGGGGYSRHSKIWTTMNIYLFKINNVYYSLFPNLKWLF